MAQRPEVLFVIRTLLVITHTISAYTDTVFVSI